MKFLKHLLKSIKYFARFTHLRQLVLITYLANFWKMVLISQQNQFLNFAISLPNLLLSLEVVKFQLLFKKASKTDPQNYNPIPILSKINERIVHDQTLKFLSKSKILCRFQSSLLTGIISVDPEKTSETNGHQIFTKKMKYLGFSKKVIAWFKSQQMKI